MQKETDLDADFIRRLEHVFQRAYGHEKIASKTHEMILYGHLQVGLLHLNKGG